MSDAAGTPEITLPSVELNIYKAKTAVEVPIVESYVATEEKSPNFIRHITFDVTGTELEGKVIAGQSIGVVPPGERANGKPHQVRLYSVSSPSKGEGGNPNLVSTTVKRVIDEHWEEQELYLGVCSNFICNQKVGSTVMMTGPSGKNFLLPEHPEKFNYVFFATGTGIAPFRGMIIDLLEAGAQSEIALIFGCPYRTDVLYKGFFEELAAEHDNFHYVTSISREGRRADGSKRYVQSELEDSKELLYPILQKDNTLIYVCGLKGMESGIYQTLAKQGLTGYYQTKPDLEGVAPADWSREDIKKFVKPSKRVFVEVY